MPHIKASTRKVAPPARGKTLLTGPSNDQADRQRLIYNALRDMGEVIYAIACPDGTIKIGHTASLRERRRHHRVAFEDILAVMPGTHDEEQLIHQGLSQHVVRGQEYYRPHPDVLEFVNAIRARAGIPPIKPSGQV